MLLAGDMPYHTSVSKDTVIHIQQNLGSIATDSLQLDSGYGI